MQNVNEADIKIRMMDIDLSEAQAAAVLQCTYKALQCRRLRGRGPAHFLTPGTQRVRYRLNALIAWALQQPEQGRRSKPRLWTH